ncbi:hypothetical protein CMO96_03900 [Candidatus Woesebacteria bacterium]|nr:hypothetical protein [Candidatus Woesebacteria bacterium]
MAVTYTKVAFPKIEEKLYKVLNNEFANIYISSEFVEQQGDEAIRIHLASSDDMLTTNVFERREYSVELFHYYEDKDSIKRTEFVRNRVDRLKALLNDNQSIADYWYNLLIPSIEYDLETDRENFSITQINITMENHDSV